MAQIPEYSPVAARPGHGRSSIGRLSGKAIPGGCPRSQNLVLEQPGLEMIVCQQEVNKGRPSPGGRPGSQNLVLGRASLGVVVPWWGVSRERPPQEGLPRSQNLVLEQPGQEMVVSRLAPAVGTSEGT